MDNKTTITELKESFKDFCEIRDWAKYHSPKDLAIGLSIEASELLEHFRFKTKDEEYEILKNKKEDIEDELSDILAYILRFAQMYDIDLSTSFENKLEKNNKKYPVEKVKGKNKKYHEY